MDFSETDVSKAQKIGLYFLHAEFTMFVAVLFINYLIASFSYYLAEILDKKHIIRYVQTTQSVCQYEKTFEYITRYFLWNYQKNCFITDDVGRMYVSKSSFLHNHVAKGHNN